VATEVADYLPDGSMIVVMLSDYAGERAQLRACLGLWNFF
jgi:hypothetical protein